jgi:ATP-dependent helicase/nuclease subunit B
MRGRGEGMLTDAERSSMLENGVELAPGAAADSFAERFLVYTALTRSSEYLWVSYPLADEEGKGLSPSLVIQRLKDLGGTILSSLPLEIAKGREKEYLVHPVRSLSHLAAGFRQYKRGEDINEVWWEVYNWALTRPSLQPKLSKVLAGLFHHNAEDNLQSGLALKLYPRRSKLRGSVTRFENYRACPFKHFAEYGLGLKERAVFRLAAPDFGQFLHAALKGFGERMVKEGRDWGSVSQEEYSRICGEIVDELAPKLQNEILLSSGQHKHLLRRLLKTVERSVSRLIEFDRVSRFKPLVFEKAFGRTDDASLPPLVYRLSDGTVLELTGQIDRLDYAEHDGKKYVLVLDYKSGGAWLKLSDVYYGLKLQLLTYLLAAENSASLLVGEAECLTAGILYYFLKNPTLSGSVWLSPEEITQKMNAMLKMPGWTIAEPEVIRLIDSSCTTRSDFLKVALKKDDSFYSNCLAYVKTAEEFRLLLQYVEKMLVSTAEDIMQGNIAIQPYRLNKQAACTYCRYLPVCQFDRLLPENDYRKLTEESDDILMGLLRKAVDPQK